MKEEIICPQCGYRYWVDMVFWSIIPPDRNCPRCFPSVGVAITTTGTLPVEQTNQQKGE